MKLTLTLLLFQPAALAAGMTDAAPMGAVRSILTTTVVAILLLPAISVQMPRMLIPVVSAVTVLVGVQYATPL